MNECACTQASDRYQHCTDRPKLVVSSRLAADDRALFRVTINVRWQAASGAQ